MSDKASWVFYKFKVKIISLSIKIENNPASIFHGYSLQSKYISNRKEIVSSKGKSIINFNTTNYSCTAVFSFRKTVSKMPSISLIISELIKPGSSLTYISDNIFVVMGFK
jgi:hypothetical protein